MALIDDLRAMRQEAAQEAEDLRRETEDLLVCIRALEQRYRAANELGGAARALAFDGEPGLSAT